MKKRGFTLIEIIATLSLLIMFFGITLQGDIYSNLKSNYEVDTLLSNINYVKSLALQGNEDANIDFDISQNSYSIKTRQESQIIQLKNVKITEFTVNENAGNISFSNSGWTNGATIKLSNNKTNYTITVATITGRIKLEKD